MDLTAMVHTLWEYQNFDSSLDAFEDVELRGLMVASHIRSNSTDMSLPASVRAKWRWLRFYWNDVMQDHQYFSLVE